MAKWRVVDTPLLQPKDPHAVVFASWGPWSTNFETILRAAQWLESTGRQVWIEGPGDQWLNSEGGTMRPPPQYYRRTPKRGFE